MRTATNTMKNLYRNLVLGNGDFGENEGIYFVLKISGKYHGFSHDRKAITKTLTEKYLHFILLQNHQIFVTENDDDSMPDSKKFKNVSNHQSCWKFDGFTDIYKTRTQILNDLNNIPENERFTHFDFINFDLYHNPIIREVFKFVNVKKEPLNILNKNFKKLTDINIIRKSILM